MPTDILKKTIKAGAKVAQVGVEAERMKDTISNAVEDGVTAAKRAVKRGRYAAEDLIDEAAYRVKKHPLESAGVVFGIGLSLGIMIGWLIARDGRSSDE
ncbi:MAG TPA: hypothetical protein VFD58_11135 [Blastocatellia bacterium]|nr:hypothetical protein [Blastocatellia bacterium]